jgi:copper homeostasis protein
MRLEICCFDEKSVELASKNGIKQIEFCENRELGGISPSTENMLRIIPKYDLKIHIMVRPRGGDFCYSEEEFEWMKHFIETWKNSQFAGFVFGILTPQNTIDTIRNKQLIDLAYPIPCTLHKAIDETIDFEKAVQDAISLNFKSILTSGGESSALEGFETLVKITEKYGKKIEFKIAGGIRSNNCSVFVDNPTQFQVIHSASIINEGASIDEIELKSLKKCVEF